MRDDSLTLQTLAELKALLIRDREAGTEKAAFQVSIVLELVNAAMREAGLRDVLKRLLAAYEDTGGIASPLLNIAHAALDASLPGRDTLRLAGALVLAENHCQSHESVGLGYWAEDDDEDRRAIEDAITEARAILGKVSP